MKKALLFIVSAALGLLLVGCQSSPKPSSAKPIQTITGTVAYRERIALPDHALVTVMLQDVSLADAPAQIIAKHRFETNGMQVPLEFDLAFDSRKIDARHTYSVSARIEIDGKLRFITDTHYAVITDENNTKHVNLRLIGVGSK
ncbi:YbaY family lipoprotein [Vibrio aestuarianus]|uniref:Lipo-like protein n=1 Tax=Vibrio aestuarianus TaxID=28171 RepID=A0ABM9FNT2_9VIBR|nr:YbaY family lipoprotein [Vibrio aestuarianus]MDE1210486.1 YbaY family lipoprotein [Vibrio aestuarianus]MDE1215315.1 YbaY family lipoprotein [Vibrio aestuarianus]MDE1216443.1 YbaY family lipoprotein [Vibrio aestuarianus]MDE1227748.1 YbaY family lipoprotein [Vibrio aestuarianus]MDE1254748.1 YbaY family lipoprotein [Vibrio aestuarianus]